jgi:acetyl-CoA carboxylase biotin carboxyl carrier protein
MKPEDIEDLRQLIEFLKAHQVAEFDLDRGDVKIRLKFQQEAPASPGLADLARVLSSAPAVAGQAPSAAKGAAAASPAAAAEDPDEGLHFVQSPMVGTFYASPSPGAASFVSPGDQVEKGQVICIIEAMKLMNEIESDADGEIVKCLVSNGQAIEFGQRLFAIRPV